jgi:hypothetical protein
MSNGYDTALIFLDPRPNALIIGDKRARAPILERIVTDAKRPLHRTELPGTLALPESNDGTLLVDDVAGLSADQQMRLLRWLDDRRHMQVISTSERNLYSLVETGAFLDALYYRLNVITLDLASKPTNRILVE